ncbi:MAG: hypothetical protein EOM37_05020 [Proteobacteria bacterium]|jgi:threonyl-tRNA synthetase|nr:aminoacyl--tRNA ligase-related protein [Alphaproteobacteria bacterium]NCC03394.1 hypothetical protein [Pseudomonadota bacterium]
METTSVLKVDGTLRSAESCDDAFIQSLLAGTSQDEQQDSTVKAAIDAKLVAKDPASPEGMYVLLPRGAIMASLIEEHVRRFHASEEAFPLMPSAFAKYSLDAVRSHAALSGENVYHCQHEGQDHILRHGTLFSQFALCSQETLRTTALPLRMYEISPCFRHEAGTRIAPLKRPRSFKMIDMHAICCDLEQAKEECQRLHRKVHEHASGFSWKLRSTYTVDEKFWKADSKWVRGLAKQENGASLLKKADPKKQRPINIEYHVFGQNGALEVAAIQIDCCNPGRFGLRMDNGKPPVALHLSIVGSVERCLYALVMNAKNDSAMGIPPWLAPEQVRFLTHSKESEDRAKQSLSRFRMAGLRATIDDRGLSLDEKKNRAAQAFVPYIVGGTESPDGDEILKKLISETKLKPQHPASFPSNLSRWPEGFCV